MKHVRDLCFALAFLGAAAILLTITFAGGLQPPSAWSQLVKVSR